MVGVSGVLLAVACDAPLPERVTSFREVVEGNVDVVLGSEQLLGFPPRFRMICGPIDLKQPVVMCC